MARQRVALAGRPAQRRTYPAGMATSDADLLSRVTDAINGVLVGGQSYTIGARTFTRANLGELRKLRAELEARVRRATDDTGGVTHVEFGDPDGQPSSWSQRMR